MISVWCSYAFSNSRTYSYVASIYSGVDKIEKLLRVSALCCGNVLVFSGIGLFGCQAICNVEQCFKVPWDIFGKNVGDFFVVDV